MSRVFKTLRWSALALGVLLLLLVALACWLLFTTSGARWAAAQVTERYVPQVKYAQLDGTLAGGLTLTQFRFDGGPDALRAHAARLNVEPVLSALMGRTLYISSAGVSGLEIWLPAPKDPVEPDGPLWVEPPLTIVVNSFTLNGATIHQDGEVLAKVKQLGLSARWSARELDIDSLTLQSGDVAGELRVSGRIVPEQDTVRANLKAAWQDVVVPEQYAGRVLESRGEVDIDGTPEAYEVKGAMQLGPPGEPTQVVLDISGTDQMANIRHLDLEQQAGQLTVRGEVTFAPVGWNLNAHARGFNPGELLAQWPGKIDLDVTSEGQVGDAGPSGTLRIERLSGTLRGRPIAGEGELVLTAPSRLAGDVQLSSGSSRITVKGNAAEQQSIDATVELAVASLNDWVPDTQGSLTGKFRVRGVWPDLTIAGTAEGRALAMGETRLAKLHVDATVETPLDPGGKVRVTATGLEVAGYDFDTLAVNASGNQGQHRVSLEADGEKLDVNLELTGALNDEGWRGELERLDLAAPNVSNLKLRAPAQLSAVAGALQISQACLEDGAASLCVEASSRPDGVIEASYSFEQVPLGLVNAIAPQAMPGELRGEVAGKGNVRRAADGQWFGEADIQSPSAQLVLHDAETGTSLEQRDWLLYENLELKALLKGTSATADLSAALQGGGSLSATFEVSHLTAQSPSISGKVDAKVPSLAPYAAFVPTVSNLDGVLNAQIVVSGTFAAPEVTGNVDARQLQADLGELGIELRDGRVEGEARSTGGFRLAGSVASGKGHVEFAGNMDEHGVVDLKILGQNFLAADIPAARVVLTPNLTLTGNSEAYLLRGEVTIPSADINLQKLPQDEPPGVSPDVVVVRNGEEVVREQSVMTLPLHATVTVKLGENINIQGFGLDATVAGQLEVRETPGQPATGAGQLTVAGRYKAYGQDLTIQSGRLLFAGTPLDNPRLAIVAMRQIDSNLQTGLRIGGSARRPIITVISEPNVGEADALSYLVTGRSLSDVGSASGSSQDALSSATRSLEGAGAGLVAKRIGQRLGLDEAGVEENEMIGGSALTVGEYLSPRLYLSYGVGLFEPGEVISLRYRLSKEIGVRVQRGSEETRAGIEYRIER